MGQQDIIDLLRKEGRPLSRGQIAKKLKILDIKVSMTLRQLLKYNEVQCFELDRHQASDYCGDPKLLRRTRFYYVHCESGTIIKALQ